MSDTTAKEDGTTTRAALAGGAYQKLLAFAGLIVLVVGFSLASPSFLQTANIISILQATSVNGVLAVGVTLIIITGGIDLSIGTLMTFTAVTAGVGSPSRRVPVTVPHHSPAFDIRLFVCPPAGW